MAENYLCNGCGKIFETEEPLVIEKEWKDKECEKSGEITHESITVFYCHDCFQKLSIKK